MAKLRGRTGHCEVTPHHLWFTNDACDYRVNPAHRTADDVQALVDGIRSGIVDAIAFADHAPLREDKLRAWPVWWAARRPLASATQALQTGESAAGVLVHPEPRPAEILGLARAGWSRASTSTLLLVDLDTPYTVNKDKLHSKSHNTPFDGVEL